MAKKLDKEQSKKVNEESIVEEKKVKKAKKKKAKKTSGITKEMKEVRWPTLKEMGRYVISTIVFVIILALFFQLMDVISSYVKGLF